MNVSDLSLYMRTRTLSDVLVDGMYKCVYLNKAFISGSPPWPFMNHWPSLYLTPLFSGCQFCDGLVDLWGDRHGQPLSTWAAISPLKLRCSNTLRSWPEFRIVNEWRHTGRTGTDNEEHDSRRPSAMNDHVGRPSIRLQTGVTQRNTQYGRNRNTSEFPGRHDLSPELIVINIQGQNYVGYNFVWDYS